MFKKLFGKKEAASETINIYAPVSGRFVPLAEVPDPVFAQKMMGDGVAIEPSEGTIVSPIKGEIVLVFPTMHAIGLKAENGAELLVHIGLDTVIMNGEGFTLHVEEGDKVAPGDKLVTFDLELVKLKAKSAITPVIITNSDDMQDIERKEYVEVVSGQSEIMIVTSS
ncbi:PTS sugar transporter subunit IIA [Pseudobacillus wudalianchiensis]|uniref:PTS glucose transporter subunit IIA n=1 Tax=Pseudobacillus wudalianchiensis TaxID=1743143 RepID=A0A1B9AGB5_9BACI|nr:PTS glucose transporter subunit IIA [Bacillus wudalianchiensis]OCA82877.1 PTS glucose transporter subunit IIA [Bacillus wudalianchiensis]